MLEFKHTFSGKSFQSLLLFTINEFSAASIPTRKVLIYFIFIVNFSLVFSKFVYRVAIAAAECAIPDTFLLQGAAIYGSN
jgi:hypothetical protein